MANQKVLYDNTKDIDSGQLTYKAYLVKKQIIEQLKYYGVVRNETYTDEQLDRCASQISRWWAAAMNWGTGSG